MVFQVNSVKLRLTLLLNDNIDMSDKKKVSHLRNL